MIHYQDILSCSGSSGRESKQKEKERKKEREKGIQTERKKDRPKEKEIICSIKFNLALAKDS